MFVTFLAEWGLHLVEMAGLLLATSFVLGVIRHGVGTGWVRYGLGRQDGLGLVAGALLGAVTPVCSCSVSAVYASLLRHGASTRAAAAFLFAAPAVNEVVLVAVVLTLGWQGALLYLCAGLVAAVATGHFSQELRLQPCARCTGEVAGPLLHDGSTIRRAGLDTLALARSLAPALVIGSAIAGAMAVAAFDATHLVVAAKDWTFAPIVATLVGLPLHVEPALVAGLVLPLAESGLAMGTLISLTMAITVASVPEGALLRRLVGWRGLGALAAWYGLYISSLGLIVNALWA